MSCSEFIERFSDYFDGLGDAELTRSAETHLASCAACRRYRDVVAQGRELFRATTDDSAPSLSSDFYPRLRHRIYHIEDEEALARGSTGSAATAATIVGMAALLAAVAWIPLMRPDRPEIELAPIVVSRPTAPSPLGLRPPPVSLSHAAIRPARTFDRRSELWDPSQHLLWEYSPLYESYTQPASFRPTRVD